MFVTGTAQTGVLVALNISKRNSSLVLSVKGNCRKTDKSRFFDQSERKESRPRLPNVKGAGKANPAGLIHCLGDLSEGYALPMRLRRS